MRPGPNRRPAHDRAANDPASEGPEILSYGSAPIAEPPDPVEGTAGEPSDDPHFEEGYGPL